MSCGHCKAAIEKEVGKIEGVKSVLAEPTTKEVVVRSHFFALQDAIYRT